VLGLQHFHFRMHS